jgi:hypothetical protein
LATENTGRRRVPQCVSYGGFGCASAQPPDRLVAPGHSSAGEARPARTCVEHCGWVKGKKGPCTESIVMVHLLSGYVCSAKAPYGCGSSELFVRK